MKSLLFSFALLTAVARAQSPAPAPKPKPPIGVPADAQFFNGHWFRVYLEKGVSWSRAKQKCEELGGQLVAVPDAATWAFVRGMNTATSIWLGATDEKTTGVWLWTDGSPAKSLPWAQNQPDNAGGVEHYLVMWHDHAADIPKDGKVGAQRVDAFVCEWKK